MPAVATLTLSPALDKSTAVAGIVPDQKLHCAPLVAEPGGGGINVSRGLRRLGTPSVAIYPAGGPTGAQLEALLAAENIASRVIPTKSAVRENFVVVDTNTNQQYRFGMPGPPLTASEQLQVLEVLHQFVRRPEYLVISGSLPAGVHPSFLTKVVRQAREMGIKVIADTSGPALHAVIEAGAYLIKPNLGELSHLAGEAELDSASVPTVARQLMRAGRCEIVVVSQGAQGACLITPEWEDHIPAPAVKRRSTVGAGDSLVAGLVHALVHAQPLREAVRLGVACGTAATLNPGTELFHRADAEKLYHWLLKTMPAARIAT
ncbi:1-phosphofructokinase family hexose kinase [Hymenobacter armeniacus]|uniref:1-phosphofructokinase family hexose kinase n=1 Tax=Hymenobacter armeniacus TaxID=2771358 RepID=A0ABR8JQI0_9BACT|nr:1-phosphofructokinase family hexose kinase [Hymenobacter armeniacus]MBD2721051.1 1-phosphofructokinase family hexose kinase [Hymenobacter armeniacus]